MSGIGEKILGLATPQPQRPLPIMLTIKPLSFRERMDNTQTFLDSLRTPEDNHEEVDVTPGSLSLPGVFKNSGHYVCLPTP